MLLAPKLVTTAAATIKDRSLVSLSADVACPKRCALTRLFAPIASGRHLLNQKPIGSGMGMEAGPAAQASLTTDVNYLRELSLIYTHVTQLWVVLP